MIMGGGFGIFPTRPGRAGRGLGSIDKHIKRLSSSPDVKKRMAALSVLGRYGGGEGVKKAIVEAMQNDESDKIRSRAAEFLGLRKECETVDLLMTVAEKDAVSEVREAAVYALYNLTDKTLHSIIMDGRLLRLKPIEKKYLTAFLRKTLREDSAENVRFAAAVGLSKFDEKDMVPVLAGFCGSTRSDIRRETVNLLGNMGRDAVPVLEARLEDKEKMVRWQAIISLGKVGGKPSLPAVKKRLCDKDLSVVALAVRFVATHGGSDELPLLANMLDDSRQSVRGDVVREIGRFGKAALPYLEKAVNDKSSSVRRAALHSLGSIKENAAEALILKTFETSQSKETRYEALTALGKFDVRKNIKYFFQALQAEDAVMRGKAFVILDNFVAKIDIPVLQTLLVNEIPEVRSRTIQLLAKIGDLSAVPALIGRLKDDDSAVRNNAANALSRITGKKFGRDAGSWRRWWKSSRH